MALLFSYGTLVEDEVQLATFGRRLAGRADTLPGYETTLIPIDDPQIVAESGHSHYVNIVPNGDAFSGVRGTALEVSAEELILADAYEQRAAYVRRQITLASGAEAWVYLSKTTRDR